MLSYLIRRLLGAIGIFLLVTYAIWLLTTATGYATFHHLRFSDLVPIPYLLWLSRVFQGNLGYSVKEHEPVLSAIQSHLPITILLVIPAFLVQQLLAIGLGMQAGAQPRSWFDRLTVGAATMLVSIPGFWFALLGVSFAVVTGWLPAFDIANLRLSGYAFASPGYWSFFAAHRVQASLDIAQHLILPVLVLALLGAAGDGMYVRQTIAEVMQTDYIRAARAKGLPGRIVLWKHALRNALLPILTNVTSQLPQLVFAAAIVEFIFQLPGAGALFVHAVYIPPSTKDGPQGLNGLIDYPLLTGTLLFFGAVTLFSGIFTDVLYGIADPRVRVAQAQKALVVNPLRSPRTLAQVGPIHLRLGTALSAGLVALIVAFGLATVNELRQVYAPVSADWSGSGTYVDQTNATISVPVLLHLVITSNGTVKGEMQACRYYGYGNVASFADVDVTGETDNLSTISFSGLATHSEIFELQGVSVRGSYTGEHGAIAVQGTLFGSNYYGVFQLNPGGSLAQFQRACAQIAK